MRTTADNEKTAQKRVKLEELVDELRYTSTNAESDLMDANRTFDVEWYRWSQYMCTCIKRVILHWCMRRAHVHQQVRCVVVFYLLFIIPLIVHGGVAEGVDGCTNATYKFGVYVSRTGVLSVYLHVLCNFHNIFHLNA
jgi:hypothetical protein